MHSAVQINVSSKPVSEGWTAGCVLVSYYLGCAVVLGPLAAAPGPREKFSLSCVISLSSHAGVQWVLNHDTHDSAERSKSLMFRGKLLTQ